MEENDHRKYFITNLHKSVGPGQDRTCDPMFLFGLTRETIYVKNILQHVPSLRVVLKYCHKPRFYRKTCLKWPLSKRPKIGFQDQLSLNVGQKYCRMLQGEHSAILATCIELPHGFKTLVLSIFEWPLMAGFTVLFNPFWSVQTFQLNTLNCGWSYFQIKLSFYL